MFLLKEQNKLIWTASDLTVAAECEYRLLRTIDYRLEWAEEIATPNDLLMEQAAIMGDRHEKRLLEEHKRRGATAELSKVEGKYTVAALKAMHETTRVAFDSQPLVVYQAGFFDGEFHGYADFVEKSASGWVVSDAKLARSARPKALLQLGAYAEQIAGMGLPLANTVSLLLSNGRRVDFPTDDLLAVFRERRDRLRRILIAHHREQTPVAWGDERYTACGRCHECAHAAMQANDVLLVAGLRMDQRRKLRAERITTIGELAKADTAPATMTPSTFDKLRAQAKLQWEYMQDGPTARVRHELTSTAPQTLQLLPAASEGDLFFDFEGDPLYDEGDPAQCGLEYLWGVMDTQGQLPFQHRWAHDRKQERTLFIEFMDFVSERRKRYPDLHIYHYAPYETTALKRLAGQYLVKQDELDTLLRDEVLVDLYATVRGSVRISADSYSIKKLEPLYMGEQLRNQDGVTSGGDSIHAYHLYREQVANDPAAAKAHLDRLDEYNYYDCLSTQRLRDWLLERAREAKVEHLIASRTKDSRARTAEEGKSDPAIAEAQQRLTERLMTLSGDTNVNARTAEQQCYAMLASALNYFRRERNVSWWEHFNRLQSPIDEWLETRDVFAVEKASVVQDWERPSGRARNHRRVLELVGDWAPASRPRDKVFAVFNAPNPFVEPGVDGALYWAAMGEIEADEDDPRTVRLTLSRAKDQTFSDLPLALAPGKPLETKHLEAAIEQLARAAAESQCVPDTAIFDLLLRRSPRLPGTRLPSGGNLVADCVAALTAMHDSYVAIQGPPGTGKTYTGARIIRELVEQHHWRIAVVAQSHAVVENMLDGIVEAGLNRDLVGKSNPQTKTFGWVEVADSAEKRADFLRWHRANGCVLGGTAWTFSNPELAGAFDLLVVDEAGQYSLCMTMAASVAANRLLLLGDPQQLPQVSQATHAEFVDESALGWLMRGHDTLPAKYGYFLPDSYRMHPALCERVSTLSYERRLRSAAKASDRKLAGVDPGIVVVEVPHVGNRTESIEESQEVVRQVRALLGKTWQEDAKSVPRPLAPDDVLVVVPYNAQVASIRKHLESAGFGATRVGTVDKFQGQEAPIAIVSMTASSHGDVPRGMGFLLNRNRINVAVSRAKWRVIIVRSANLTDYMPSSVEELLHLGGFIGLCGSGNSCRTAQGDSGDTELVNTRQSRATISVDSQSQGPLASSLAD